MSTRSVIAVMHGDNYKAVYCHHDGDLGHNGKILFQHYNSAKANHLIALGDISSLSEEVEIPEGIEHSYDDPQLDITVFYGRDRGESDVEFRTLPDWESFMEFFDNCTAEYGYIMKDGVWYFVDGSEVDPTPVPLADALEIYFDEA